MDAEQKVESGEAAEMQGEVPLKVSAVADRKKQLAKDVIFDVITAMIAGVIVALGIHMFISYNGFVPGGTNGLANILGALIGWNAGYFLIIITLPIYVLVFFFVKKRVGVILIIYMGTQSASQILFDKFSVFVYHANEATLMIASLCGGVITGIGFGLMLRRFGASGGTYAISALVRRWKPQASVVWLSFVMDASVIIIAFFAYSFKLESMIYTFINLFVANKVAEAILQGVKTGYKYEMVTDRPDELADELMSKIGCSVTRISAQGMYSHEDRSMLVCVIRKRQIGDIQRTLKRYPKTVVFITQVSDTMGGRFGKNK